MGINKIIRSIIERPSFNLLAFQAFTFVLLAIAGAAGAFQFVPFFGFEGVYTFYFIGYFYIAAAVIIYTSIIFLIGSILKKLYILLFNKYLIITNLILFYIIYSILIWNYHTAPATPSEGDGYAWILVFGIGFLLYGILYCALPLYILTAVVELIRRIRLAPMQYQKTPLRMCAVVILALVYVCVILYILIEMLT